jgi:uncharacterized membrane protein
MKFQIERIALFSDAVFAIAITLMMIEIKAPHLGHHVSFMDAFLTFLQLLPVFIGTILSFFLIGMFWIRHHELMKYMAGYTTGLLWRNISFLLCIAFIPFSTSFVFENLEAVSPFPLLIYNLNYIVATILEYRLFAYVLDPKNNIRSAEELENPYTMKRQLLFPVFVYVLVSAVAFIQPSLAPVGYAAFSLEGIFVKARKRQQ